MRVIVFSDSHGVLRFARRALEEAGRVDLMLHAGDFCRDGLRLAGEAGLPVRAVRGNCDDPGEGPLEEVVEASGCRILLAHGHMGGPERWLERLLAKAAECGAGAVVFGHTHTAEIFKEKGILFFNPGSIARPRDYDRPSYGILEIGSKGLSPFLHRI